MSRKKSGTVRPDLVEFGHDVGLMQEALVTGRKIGAGKNFWAGLAHDRNFFGRVLHLAHQRGHGELIQDVFVPPHVQLEIARVRNNERGWGFTQDDFDRLEKTIPVWPEPTIFKPAVILDINLGDVRKTFAEAWRHVRLALPDSCYVTEQTLDLEGEITTGQCLQTANPHLCERGMRWTTLKLRDLDGMSLEKVLWSIAHSGYMHKVPDSAILWMASYSPEWIRSMNGTTRPFVWLTGYRFTDNELTWVPRLTWDGMSGKLVLGAGLFSEGHPSFSVPVPYEYTMKDDVPVGTH